MTAGGQSDQSHLGGGVNHVAVVCPSCGFNLIPERVIEIGALWFDPYGDARWNGEPVHLTPNERIVLGALVAAKGLPTSSGALEERLGYWGEFNLANVYICRLRRLFAAIGADFVRHRRSLGYSIDLDALKAAEHPHNLPDAPSLTHGKGL